MDKKEKIQRAAIHEAGHALMSFLIYGNLNDISHIEINTKYKLGKGQCGISGKLQKTKPIKYTDESGENYWLGIFCFQMAGACAEAILFQEGLNDNLVENDLNIFTCNKTAMELCGLLKIEGNGYTVFSNLKNKAITFSFMELNKPANKKLIEKISKTLLAKEEIKGKKSLYASEILKIIDKPEH